MFWLVTAIQIIAYGGFVFCIDKGGPAFAGQVSYIVTASGVLVGSHHLPTGTINTRDRDCSYRRFGRNRLGKSKPTRRCGQDQSGHRVNGG